MLMLLFIPTLDAITLIHLPDGPTAYFKLSSYTPAKKTPVREG